MGLANAATVVGHACPYPNFTWFSRVPFLNFQMSPRRSVRQKRPSTEALEALAGSEGPPVRRRRAAGQNPSSSGEPAPPSANPVVAAPPDAVLPAGFLDQVVARVTTEVTRQLQPLLSGAHAQQSDVSLQTESSLPPRSNTANEALAPVQPTVAAAVTNGQTRDTNCWEPGSAGGHFHSDKFIR